MESSIQMLLPIFTKFPSGSSSFKMSWRTFSIPFQGVGQRTQRTGDYEGGLSEALTQGTEHQKVQLQWDGWPGLRLPPSGALSPVGGAWPGGRWRAWGPCTSAGGLWCAAHCACSLSWHRRGRPPWNWPGNWKLEQKISWGLKYWAENKTYWVSFFYNALLLKHLRSFICMMAKICL